MGLWWLSREKYGHWEAKFRKIWVFGGKVQEKKICGLCRLDIGKYWALEAKKG